MGVHVLLHLGVQPVHSLHAMKKKQGRPEVSKDSMIKITSQHSSTAQKMLALRDIDQASSLGSSAALAA